MIQTEFGKGFVISNKGGPLRKVHIITQGTAAVTIHGQVFQLSAGDAIGLCAVTSGTFQYDYTALTDVLTSAYTANDPACADVLAKAITKRLSAVLKYYAGLKDEADKAFSLINEQLALYERLSGMYALTAKTLPTASGLAAAQDGVKSYLQDYYFGVNEVDEEHFKAFFANSAVAWGYLQQGCDDFTAICEGIGKLKQYLGNITRVFIDSSGHDLLALISELHLDSISIKGADETVKIVMAKLMRLMSSMTYVDAGFYRKRLETYSENLKLRRAEKGIVAPVQQGNGVKQNLSDSLDIILKYGGMSQEQTSRFTHLVNEYTGVSDRNSSDENVHRLRKELTNTFNELYMQVFLNSLHDRNPSTIIKMFLKFGYVDAGLAGFENADYLYSIADSLKGDPSKGFYTINEWLTEIYRGRKEPCRNEFDLDFPAHVAELKTQRKITEAEATRLLSDNLAKLKFELESTFPIVNKLTYGRIMVYCPLFSSHNVQRGIENALITPSAIHEVFAEIRKNDFSAFYRPAMYSNLDIGISKETIHSEIMPNMILMPNIGTRGIMWQDIEGRKRNTSARMFAPLFLLTELKTLLIQLTGEFRWEMCKRIQGSRWQDITDLSLTSEYSDYLQFYRSNRELSQELKEGVKQELTRARNNYKAVFVSNYVDWLMYETNGSPRLNKMARRLMLTYCPFPAEMRENLALNPQYAEPLKRYNFKNQQRELQLSRLINKLQQTGVTVPEELKGELKFVRS